MPYPAGPSVPAAREGGRASRVDAAPSSAAGLGTLHSMSITRIALSSCSGWPDILDGSPHALGGGRHLDVLDAQLGQRVDDGVDHGAESRRRSALAAAAQAERMRRRGHLADLGGES